MIPFISDLPWSFLRWRCFSSLGDSARISDGRTREVSSIPDRLRGPLTCHRHLQTNGAVRSSWNWKDSRLWLRGFASWWIRHLMSGEMGGSWSEVHQGLGHDRMKRSILHVTSLEVVRWDCSCFLKCPVFFCTFQNGGSFYMFVPWKCSSSAITVQPSRVKFLIWIPKQQNLLLLSWFWWKCVNLSLFNPSDKSPFSFVFTFIVVETTSLIDCWWP